MRFTNYQVINEIEHVIKAIEKKIKDLKLKSTIDNGKIESPL
jgi:hypothetical protein